MRNKIFRKFFAVLLSFMMILSMSIASFADMLDVSSHWAKDEIDYLTSKDVVGGYPDGEFKPDNTITRAEFFKIINNVFGYSDKAEISFNDVKSTDWYYEEIQKAVEAGYANGYPDNTIKPNGEITRQEAAKVVAITFGLDEEDSYSWSTFNDNNSIATWARDYVGVICDKGFVSGYKDGTYRPENKLTRAEAVKMISNAAAALYNVSGSYSEDVNGNVIVNITDVTLRDMTIKGDLYLAEGIGNGDATLDGVTVKGKTFVRAGGEDSIHINNSSLGEINVAKTKKNVRIVLSGEITIPSLTIDENTIVVIGEGVTIKNLQVNGKANIQLAKGATIENAVINSTGVEIAAEGNIGNLQANEDVKVNGQDVKEGEKITIEEGKKDREPIHEGTTPKEKEQTKYNATFTVMFEVYNPTVTDEVYYYIPDVQITIDGIDGLISTNNDGKAEISLASGNYNYTVTHEVYKTISNTFTINNEDIDVEVIMEEKDEVQSYESTGYEASEVKLVQEGNKINDHKIGFKPPINSEKEAEVKDNFKGWLVIYSAKNKIEVWDYLKGLTEEQIEDYSDTQNTNRIYKITNFYWADGLGNTYSTNQKDVVTGKEFGPGLYYLYVATYTNDGVVGLAQADKNIDIKPAPRNVKLGGAGDAIEDYVVDFSSFYDERITYNLIFYSKDVVYRYTIQDLLGKNKEEIEALNEENKAKLVEDLTGPISFNPNQKELDGTTFGEGIYYIYVATVGEEGILGISYAIETIITESNPEPKTDTIREGKGIVFPIGGAASKANFDYILESAKEGNVERPRIAIFNSSRDDYATVLNHFYYDDPTYGSLEDTFAEMGFEPVFIPLAIDSSCFVANNQYYSDLVKSCDAVLLQGGDQNKHAKSLLNDDGTDTEIMKAIRFVIDRGGIVAGTSAGMHVMSNPVFGYGTSDVALQTNETEFYGINDIPTSGDLFPEIDNNNLAVPGIGIVPDNVLNDTHFDARGRLGRLIVGLRDTEKRIGIGCDEGTGLAIRGNIGTVVGDHGVFIVDTSDAVYGEKGSNNIFDVKGLKMHYLTEGDKYNFDTNQVIVAEDKIAIASDSSLEIYETEDIFGKYETTKTIISFAHNDAEIVKRKVKTKGTLLFDVTFYKGSDTEAYTSTLDYIDDELEGYNKTTIIGMKMDVAESDIVDIMPPVISGVEHSSKEYTVYILITDENSGIDETTINKETVKLISEVNTMYETSPQYEPDYDDIKVSINEDAYVAGDTLVISGIKDLAGNEVESQTWERQEDGTWVKQ